MILKASQRGGAEQLGLHLMRLDENEHVELHQIRGFVSDDVIGAPKEAQAVAAGTRCTKPIFLDLAKPAKVRECQYRDV
ncbi:MAG: hypothetical protein P1U65_14940 [Minwuia sp.]|nr:hypothetical protein [Minwuia sp.]